MTKSNKTHPASTSRKLRIGGLSLIAGSTAFLTFWVYSAASSSVIVPWSATLAVHGMSIILLSIGLVLVARNAPRRSTGYWMPWVGTAVAIAGLLTVFPLIPVGFGIFGVGLVLAGRDRLSAFIAVAGSVLLLMAVILGARVGMEGSLELSDGLRIAFQLGVLLIATGFIAIGWSETRRIPRQHNN